MSAPSTAPSTALIYGLAITGDAVASALRARGTRLLIADDAPSQAKRAAAAALGANLVGCPDGEVLHRLVEQSDFVVPAPGVPEGHRLIAAAVELSRPIVTELDLAYEWEQQRPGGPRPMLAITGTDGKTSTTMLAAAILTAAGHRAAAVGNTEVPLIAALDSDADVFVVECSSFRLNWLCRFRAESSVWLNLAPDHQNWHPSMEAYARAKARLWGHVRPTDVAIGFADDPEVMRNLRLAKCRQRTFASGHSDYHVDGGQLVGPGGHVADVARMRRTLPHDLTNALAAAALVLETGLAEPGHVAQALADFSPPAHRIEPVGSFRGAEWFNDSKATTLHAALTAIRSFERVVLLAGGRNKGLDLSELTSESARIVGVVALGESAGEIAAAFHGACPVDVATSMSQAVELAAAMARPGDTVLLSPACASFDWYPEGGYPARGDDFKRLTRLHFQEDTA